MKFIEVHIERGPSGVHPTPLFCLHMGHEGKVLSQGRWQTGQIWPQIQPASPGFGHHHNFPPSLMTPYPAPLWYEATENISWTKKEWALYFILLKHLTGPNDTRQNSNSRTYRFFSFLEVLGPSGPWKLHGGPLGLLNSSFDPFGRSGRVTHIKMT